MTIDRTTLPNPVQRFLKALRENALKVEGWDVKDIDGDTKCMADDVIHVSVKPDGKVTICDNYERFFPIIYDYTPDPADPDGGRWQTREMYSDGSAQDYTFDKAMADAAIMFTG